jgi:phosphatidate phosphatase
LLIHPFKRGFYCNDESIKYPYKGDTVPLWLAGVYGGLGAILIVVLTEKYKSHRCSIKGKDSSCFLNTIQGLLFYSMGAMSTMIITEVGKITIGRLRPHFLTVCEPKWDLINCFEEIQGVKVAT